MKKKKLTSNIDLFEDMIINVSLIKTDLTEILPEYENDDDRDENTIQWVKKGIKDSDKFIKYVTTLKNKDGKINNRQLTGLNKRQYDIVDDINMSYLKWKFKVKQITRLGNVKNDTLALEIEQDIIELSIADTEHKMTASQEAKFKKEKQFRIYDMKLSKEAEEKQPIDTKFGVFDMTSENLDYLLASYISTPNNKKISFIDSDTLNEIYLTKAQIKLILGLYADRKSKLQHKLALLKKCIIDCKSFIELDSIRWYNN